MKQRVFSLIILVFLLTACKSEVEDTIEGMWTIDTVQYNGYDILTCLNSNVIFFKDGEPTTFPTVDRCNDFKVKNRKPKGIWEVVNTTSPNDSIPLRIKITEGGNIFEGTHKVAFHADPSQKLLKMEIWSDSLYILSSKGMFNYDKNLSTVKRLETVSWKGKQ
jgi:hypothetical protein